MNRNLVRFAALSLFCCLGACTIPLAKDPAVLQEEKAEAFWKRLEDQPSTDR